MRESRGGKKKIMSQTVAPTKNLYESIIYYLMRIICGILLGFVIITPAYAYVDPNAGGFFFQTVAPIVYGILGVIVVFWKRIIGFVKGIIDRLRNKGNHSQDE